MQLSRTLPPFLRGSLMAPFSRPRIRSHCCPSADVSNYIFTLPICCASTSTMAFASSKSPGLYPIVKLVRSTVANSQFECTYASIHMIASNWAVRPKPCRHQIWSLALCAWASPADAAGVHRRCRRPGRNRRNRRSRRVRVSSADAAERLQHCCMFDHMPYNSRSC